MIFTFDDESIKNIIVSIVREYKWSPEIIGDLFFDGEDYKGMEFWYNDIKEMHGEMKSKK